MPNGAGIANGYDTLARLTQTILTNHWGHTLDGYTYTLDPLGLRTNILRNLGLTSSSVSVGYDNIGQLTQWFAKETNSIPRFNEQLAFGFDGADNLQFRTNGALSQTFTVDGANELTNVSRLGLFTFSGAMPAPATNITVNGVAAQTYGDFTFAVTNLSLFNGNNNFTSIARNVYGAATTNMITVDLPQSVNLAYDNNGNMTNDGTQSFLYNAENQLTNVFVPSQWRSDFVYDGLGRRRIVREYAWNGAWVKTNEIHIIYDGYLPIQERDSNDNVLVTYTRGLDLSGSLQGAGGIGGLLARTDTNGSTFYHGDGAGNVTALMDGQEDIVARYMYGPFGKLVGQWGAMANANEMQFSSMPRDNLSGLSLYPFRTYEPSFQRWVNQDPIQEWGGINLYRAMRNNPVRNYDPLGFQTFVPAEPDPNEGRDEDADPFENRTYEPTPDWAENIPTGESAIGPREDPAESPITQEQFAANIQEMNDEENKDRGPLNPSESPVTKIPCSNKGAPDFIVTPNGQVIPVPEGAIGPKPTQSPGFQFNGGAGGNGLGDNVTDVRIMDPNAQNPNGYINYGSRQADRGWQSVNPYTGQAISPADPWWHYPIDQ